MLWLVNSVNERDLNLLIKVQGLLRLSVVSLRKCILSQEICTVAGSEICTGASDDEFGGHEFIVTVALVVVDTLALARANEVREIGSDTKAMSDGAIQSHPS